MSGGVIVVCAMVYGVFVSAGLLSKGVVLIWVFMELGLMLSLILMYFWGVKLGIVVEYYIYQSSSSLMVLLGWMGGSVVIVSVSLLMKLGMFPFHVYMIKVVGELVGFMFFLVLLLQKVLPFYLVSILLVGGHISEVLVVVSVLVSVGIGCVGGLVVVWFNGMVAYSSLVHSSWMMMLLMMDVGVFIFYFLMYMLIMLMVVFEWGSSESGVGLMMSMVVMSGLPPVLSFAMKLKMLYVGVMSYTLLFYTMLLMSAVSFMYYLRLMIYYLMGGPYGGDSSGAGWYKVVVIVLGITLIGVMVV
uniref:NADH-ubiquinone oxidoreductase chain 2 n=1 Tax=Oncicola luehei TaxID=1100885 RepID=H2E2E5_9BILA|nr:NADH dehydrogenase subunit 2 [Oncicola luehei]AER42904.1 NADH dehydrogenase subunit 2 [Oncicola luehei]